MTEGVRQTMESMTGYDVGTCPWRAFSDPFVQRVRAAYPFFGSGQLDVKVPNASYKLVEGIGFYHLVHNRMQAKQFELDRDKHRREAEAARASMNGGRGGR